MRKVEKKIENIPEFSYGSEEIYGWFAMDDIRSLSKKYNYFEVINIQQLDNSYRDSYKVFYKYY